MIDQTDYYEKYIKYKLKYLNFKMVGGMMEENETQKTYTIYNESGGLPLDSLHKVMTLHNWKYIDPFEMMGNNNKFVDFVYIGSKSDSSVPFQIIRLKKYMYEVKCLYKNDLYDVNFKIDKLNLYKTLELRQSTKLLKYLPITQELDKFNKSVYPPDTVWILKPVGRKFSSGRGIQIISDASELNSIVYQYITNKTRKLPLPSDIVADDVDISQNYKYRGKYYVPKIISQYVTDIATFQQKKFHLRVYMMISVFSNSSTNIYNYAICPFGKILTAGKKFIAENYGDRDIHDSHLKTTDDNYIFPDHINLIDGMTQQIFEGIWQQILNMCEQIFIEFGRDLTLYRESQNGCKILGIDVMVKKNWDIVLIEINKQPGYTGIQNASIPLELLAEKYYDWMYQAFIGEHLKWLTTQPITQQITPLAMQPTK